MVLEEGLDISILPETLKEDFDQLDRLEGQYRVTACLMELGDLEVLSSRNGPPCSFCNVKEKLEQMKTLLENLKSTLTISKVILIDLFQSCILRQE